MSTPRQDAQSEAEPPAERRSRSGSGGGRIDRTTQARALSAVAGGALFVMGLRRWSLRGMALTAAGVAALYSGINGEGRPFDSLLSAVGSGAQHSGPGASPDAVTIGRSVTVRGDAADLLEYWRDADELDRIVSDAVDVESRGDERLHWTVSAPTGHQISWETRVVEERPDELLRWESVPDSSLPMEGSVRMQPASGDRGTEVRLQVRFDPPGGPVGQRVLSRMGVVPESLLGTTLDRFKSLVETGEVPTLDRNPSGRGTGDVV